MLTLAGSPYRLCDGFSRRSFLKIGGLALGGASLPQVLRAEAAGGTKSPHKAVIMIFLPGGPAHQDIVDLKPDAPDNIRGEFKPISTTVPGIQICEHLPRMASMMDKFAIIRSVVGCQPDHVLSQCLSGRTRQGEPAGGWPAMGSILSKLHGTVDPAVPPFVGLSPRMGHMPWADCGQPGFLGVAHAPFKPLGEGSESLTLKNLSLDQLHDRKRLLSSLDQFRREVDQSRALDGMETFKRQAFELLSSKKLVDALDLEKEDPTVRESYGKGIAKNRDDGGPRLMEHFLIARRLVEAGCRCVTLAFSRWDFHGNNFGQLREDLPMLDQGLTALVLDLHSRGLQNDVSVIVWGEFGRTPQINKDGGRDHWPNVSCAMLAGGGLRTGQVIGATDKQGAFANDRPVHMQEIFATLYHSLGVNLETTLLEDRSGRPQHLLDTAYSPLPELV